MIAAAAKRSPYLSNNSNGAPVQPNIGQRRPYQRSDENQIAAVFRPQQARKPAALADRNPVMTKTRDLRRIADALQRKQNRADIAREQGVRHREWQHATCRDQADRRGSLQIL